MLHKLFPELKKGHVRVYYVGILLMYHFGGTLSPSDTHLHPFK